MLHKKYVNRGFTLVELLAVIVILAIILVIAVPKIMSVITDSKKSSLETSAKMIASTAEKTKVQKELLGEEITGTVDCSEFTKVTNDYETCTVKFDGNTAKVNITGANKFSGLSVCRGTKTQATATDTEDGCYVKNACTFDGELVQGAVFTQDGFEYHYKEHFDCFENSCIFQSDWESMEEDGWGVEYIGDDEHVYLSDICTTINDKPVTSLSYLFASAFSTKKIYVTDYDSSKITNMEGMFLDFGNTTNDNEYFIIDFNNLNTKNVKDMSCMFRYSCVDVDFSGFNTSNVEYMQGMFANYCSAGNNTKPFEINGIENWDTSNVTNMGMMFSSAGEYATTFEIGDIGKWDVSNVINMNAMFFSAGYSATTWSIGDLSKWDTSNVEDMSLMFNAAGKSATTWSIGDLSNWDTSRVMNMASMFSSAGKSATYALDLSGWDVSNVISYDYFNNNVSSKIISPNFTS